MATNPSILLQGQPVQDPLTQYSRVLALKNALGQQQAQQQEAQQRDLQIQQQQQEMTGQKILDQAYQKAYTKDAAGNSIFNKDAVTDELVKAGQGRRVPTVVAAFTKMDEDAAKAKTATLAAKTAQSDYAASAFLPVLDSKYDPSIFVATLAHARETGAISPQQAVQFADAVAANPKPETVKGIVDQLIGASPEVQKILTTRQTAQAATDRAKTAGDAESRLKAAADAELPGKQALSRHQIISEAAAKLGAAKDPSDYQAILGKLPFEVAKDFANKTPEQARKMGLTAKEQVDTEAAAETRKEQKRRDDETYRHNLAQEKAEFARATKEAKPKSIPATVIKGIAANNQMLSTIDQAINALDEKKGGDPNAVGFKGLLPDTILNRADPRGTEARALLARVAAQEFHDFSGAAVTASEAARLKPFLPSANDDIRTVRTKLQNLKKQVKGLNDFQREVYAEGFQTLPAEKAADEAPIIKYNAAGDAVELRNGQWVPVPK